MYSNELPTRLIEQVTKIGDRTLLTIEETHHLSAREIEKKDKSGQSCHRHSLSSVLSSYLEVGNVRSLGCTTHVPEQRLGGNGKLRPRDLVCGRLIAYERDHHLDND
jgi:hypothetical protein